MMTLATNAAIAVAQQPGKSHALYYCAVILAAGLCAAIWTFVIRQLIQTWCDEQRRREEHTDWLRNGRRFPKHKSAQHRPHHRGDKEEGIM